MSSTERADVVVVGAGVLGTSVAHHLIELGAGRVVVVDAGTPSSGTSGAGAGFVGPWAAGYANFYDEREFELELYGIDFYKRLSAEHPDVDCRTNGSMYLATTDEGLEKWVGPVVAHPLAPAGTRELAPADVTELTGGVVPAEGVVGGALHPGGVQVSAGRVTRALARRVEAGGGEVRDNTRVLGLLTAGQRVVGVRTESGDISAARVVLACGAWTNDVLAEAGYSVPLLRMIATRVISPASDVSSAMPTLMVPDLYGLWVREHRGGLTWGNGDGYAPLHELGGTVGDGGQPRREELVARLDEVLSPRLRKLVPAHDTSIGWWLQGVPCMTPDRRFLVGAVPGLDELYVLAGDNESGVTHGPGLGRLLAEQLMRDGRSWVDGSGYRPDRFEPSDFPDEASVAAAMPVRR